MLGSWTKRLPRPPRKGKVLRTRETIENRSLTMMGIWGEKWIKDTRSILTVYEWVEKRGK
jgi:hypothetical protein